MSRSIGAPRLRPIVVFAAATSLFVAPGVVGRAVVPTRTASAAYPTAPPSSAPAFDAEPAPKRATKGDAHDVLSRRDAIAGVSAWPTEPTSRAASAIDGDEASAWVGATNAKTWEWRATFAAPQHLSLLRAKLGVDATHGVPTALQWDAIAPDADGRCPAVFEDAFAPIPDAFDEPSPTVARPTTRSWFVDADVCALRLVVAATNGGAPVVREIQAIEGARDVLRHGSGEATPAIDGTYEHAWSGAPGAGHWTLTVPLPFDVPKPIDRVHLLLGADATSTPRSNGIGRTYGMANAPVRYRLEGTIDGKNFFLLADELHEDDGRIVPVRRRLITFAPKPLRALRLVIDGATNDHGVADPAGFPVIREIAAYRADDRRPLLFAPWILSVNANPAGESHDGGGEWANDVFWTKFLQLRFSPWLPALRRDDRFARSMGPRGQLIDVPRDDSSGAALESIEGDDPTLDLALIEASTPRPIVVLSGSNTWDYAKKSGPDRNDSHRWRWDPLLDAKHGGMGQLWKVVAQRAAPMFGFCGGGQILALLEARSALRTPSGSPVDEMKSDGRTAALIDRVLRRTTGASIQGILPGDALVHAWPGDSRPRPTISFDARDPLFAAVASRGRRTSQEFPEFHADVVRPDAFLAGGPLASFHVVARSVFCGTNVVDGDVHDRAFRNPDAPGKCLVVPEVWSSNAPTGAAGGDGFPIVGAQFHAEQYDFPQPAGNDPADATADPRLFVAAEYEVAVDAYLKYASR